MIAARSVAIGSIYATGYINTLSDAQAVQVTPAHHQKKTTELIQLKLQKRILTILKVTLRTFRLKSYKDKAQMSTS